MRLQQNGFLLRIWGWFLITVLSLLFSFQPSLQAATAESKFYAAQQCVSQLNKNPTQKKYRHRWLKCINGFLAVYRHDPHGPWAAAGLFNAGELYYELYKRSFLQADKQDAVDLLEQVERHYTKSRYKPKAQAKLSIIKDGSTRKRSAANRTAAEKWYNKAQAKYLQIQKSARLQKYRDQWMAGIQYYRNAYEADPRGDLAPYALKGLAKSYQGLYKWSGKRQDRQAAQKALDKLAAEFPASTVAVQAGAPLPAKKASSSNSIAEVIEKAAVGQEFATPDTSSSHSKQPSIVEGLRFWSNPRYTRVVIDADQNSAFSYHELREDPSTGKPQRIYVDVHKSRLSNDLQKVVPINDNLLSDARAGQHTADTVRVVVDIKSAKTYKIFPLKNPFRIVLDVWGYEAGDTVASIQPPVLPMGA